MAFSQQNSWDRYGQTFIRLRERRFNLDLLEGLWAIAYRAIVLRSRQHMLQLKWLCGDRIGSVASGEHQAKLLCSL
ncbi:hypothetical protein NDI44_09315 [Trichocoleus sp. DQ-A3]|uniref:hypothetical protein n=1 Tax=Cyanophyceae TaxID=3028117 RepID=UPI0016889939|nr:hypothetical protein [Coleofasciculus sp. FACHB-125]MBD1902953.1 hypothetical protein [Coleofasciculus sp. FACHB-125]